MKWVIYKLYQQISIQNALGQIKSSWEYICDIEVVTSNKLYSTVNGDIVYRKFEPTAISKYKSFENGGTYKISNDNHEYVVDSFQNEGRYSQLLLKEVVSNE